MAQTDNGWDQLGTLRLVLAGIVAVTHWAAIFLQPFGHVSDSVMAALSFSAEMSVNLFFVISGLVITRSLTFLSTRGNDLFVEFMLRRVFRIYPPLLLSIVLCVAIASALRGLGLDQYAGPATPYRPSFSYLDYLYEIAKSVASFGFRGSLHGSSNGPLWSLVVEMQAYVFAGLIAQAILAKTTLVRIIAIGGILIALRARGLQWPASYEMIGFMCFAFGAALSFTNLCLPRLLPVISFEFSYSLYIFHFPIFLGVFFLLCQGAPDLTRIVTVSIAAFVVTLGFSILSGILVEPLRGWRRRSLSAA